MRITNLDRFKRKLQPFTAYHKACPQHFDPLHPHYYMVATDLHPLYSAALDSLVSKKYGNKAAAKVLKKSEDDTQADETQALMIRLYADPKKLNFEQAYIAYMREASRLVSLTKWDTRALISQQTLENFLKRPEIQQLWYSKRHGKKEAADVYAPVIHRKAASFANAKWVIDGTPLHMYFNHRGSTYQRLNIFVVLDEHSWAVVGYSLSFAETTEAVMQALRNACQNTGLMPHQVQSDNSSAIQSWHVQQAIGQIAIYNTPSAPGNARAKVIEPFFRHFNSRILKLQPGYMGNPHASLEYRPNDEYLLANRGHFPTLQEAVSIVDNSLNIWNAHVFNDAEPMRKWRESVEKTRAQQRRFTAETDVAAFWHVPGRMKQVKDQAASRKMISVFEPTEYTYTNKGIIVERKQPLADKAEKYIFQFPATDAGDFLSRHIGGKFILKIEPEHFNEARLFTPDHRPLLADGQPVSLQGLERSASALVDATPHEREALDTKRKAFAAQKATVEAQFDRYMKIAESNGHTAPIDTSWVMGKQVSTAAKSQVNEARFAALSAPQDMELVADEPKRVTPKRY
jgi:transposase InsO family protein